MRRRAAGSEDPAGARRRHLPVMSAEVTPCQGERVGPRPPGTAEAERTAPVVATRRAVLAVGLWLAALVALWAVGRAAGRPRSGRHLRERSAVHRLSARSRVGRHRPRRGRRRGSSSCVARASRAPRAGVSSSSTGWAASTAFAVLLAATDGLAAIAAPLTDENDYLAVVPLVAQDPGAFLRTFTDRALTYPVHVRGHPPGLPLLLGGLDRLGLGGEWWMAALVDRGGDELGRRGGCHGAGARRPARRGDGPARAAGRRARTGGAVAGDVGRRVLRRCAGLGRRPARRRLHPGRAVAGRGRSPRGWSWVCARSCPTGCCRWARSPWSSGSSRGGGLPPSSPARWSWRASAAWGAAGFWLPDGIAVTHVASTLGRAADRPYLYFLVADLVLLGALVGPAGVGGLAGLRRLPRAVQLLVVVALGRGARRCPVRGGARGGGAHLAAAGVLGAAGGGHARRPTGVARRAGDRDDRAAGRAGLALVTRTVR